MIRGVWNCNNPELNWYKLLWSLTASARACVGALLTWVIHVTLLDQVRSNSAFHLGGLSTVNMSYRQRVQSQKLGSEEVQVLPFSSNKLADLLRCFEKPHFLSSFAGPLPSTLWSPSLKSCSGKQQKCINRQVVQARTVFYKASCDGSLVKLTHIEIAVVFFFFYCQMGELFAKFSNSHIKIWEKSTIPVRAYA